MPVNTLRENDTVVSALQGALASGQKGLQVVPGLVVRVINENRWQERELQRTGQRAAYRAFLDFVTDPPPEGLGSDFDGLLRLCRDDPNALDLIDQVTVREHGGDRKSEEIKMSNTHFDPPTSGSRQQALRRLRKSRPDLHARVLAKEMSANAAMVEAGFRKQPTPTERMRKLWEKLTHDERDDFIGWARARL